MARRTIRKADAVIALGETYRRIFISFGVAPERVHVVYNAVPDFAGERVRENSKDRPIRILFAGEVGPRKGADRLVNALTKLNPATDWTCTIAGNGQISEYQALLERAAISEHVDFPGWLNAERVHDLMQKADIVVLPSRAEALPMSLIEGAAAGAALIATDVGATREIIDETCGIIVSSDDTSLADALQQLIDDRERLRNLQVGARRRYLERFSWEPMIASLKTIYRSLEA
jgi:glycosyltransferase involved in cell wall biosynthesis